MPILFEQHAIEGLKKAILHPFGQLQLSLRRILVLGDEEVRCAELFVNVLYALHGTVQHISFMSYSRHSASI